jgi:hypothetical protein
MPMNDKHFKLILKAEAEAVLSSWLCLVENEICSRPFAAAALPPRYRCMQY